MRIPSLTSPPRRVAHDDGLVRAVELVVTPMLFAGAGWLLDRWLGTMPILTVVFGVLALAGKVLAEWYRYGAQMDHHAEALAAERPQHARRLEPAPPIAAGTLPTGVTLEAAEGSAGQGVEGG